MNARRTEPSAALIPADGQKRLEKFRDAASTDIRKTFAEWLAKQKPASRVKLSVARSKP